MDAKDCKKPRELQLAHELSAGHEACENLGNVVTALEERLSGVLRHEPQNTDNDSEKSISELVPLAQEIRSIHEAIFVNTHRLNDFINRMEL